MKTLYQKKMIRIGILVMIIGGLTIGFATFSNTLNIKSQTTITPSSDNFQITISGSVTNQNEMSITPSISNNASATTATIENQGNRSTISNINVSFTSPGERATYYFYARNTGLIDAYFKGAKLNKINGSDLSIKCTSREETTDTLVQEACKKINVKLAFRGNNNTIWYATNAFNLSESITKNSVLWLYIEISYEGSVRADGPFDIEIGDAEFLFSTARTS